MESPKKRKSALLSEVLSKIDPNEKARVSQRMALAVQLDEALIKKGWTKSQLAEAMSKSPSEITKWLSGTHNFTVDTLSDIQRVLAISFFKTAEQPVAETRQIYIIAVPASKQPGYYREHVNHRPSIDASVFYTID